MTGPRWERAPAEVAVLAARRRNFLTWERGTCSISGRSRKVTSELRSEGRERATVEAEVGLVKGAVGRQSKT